MTKLPCTLCSRLYYSIYLHHFHVKIRKQTFSHNNIGIIFKSSSDINDTYLYVEMKNKMKYLQISITSLFFSGKIFITMYLSGIFERMSVHLLVGSDAAVHLNTDWFRIHRNCKQGTNCKHCKRLEQQHTSHKVEHYTKQQEQQRLLSLGKCIDLNRYCFIRNF